MSSKNCFIFTCKNTCTYENKSTNLQYKQFPVLREKLGLLHQTLLTYVNNHLMCSQTKDKNCGSYSNTYKNGINLVLFIGNPYYCYAIY